MTERIIAHLDMDAFFAAVEERDNPRFKGLPIAVGADPKNGEGRGVVSTANYKAREYGIHSAMPISVAWRLSERARKQGKQAVIFLPPNFERYSEISDRVMKIVRSHAPLTEQGGIGEIYFDLSSAGSYEKAGEICREIKDEIKKAVGLTSSVGIGPNKLIAKIASDFRKPDGLTTVEEKDSENFLESLPVRKIPGIGPKTEIRFKEEGVATVKDLKKFSRNELELMMGKWGAELYERIRGVDDSPVSEDYEAKSIGEQETFEADTLDPVFVLGRLKILAGSVFDSFQKSGFRNFRTVGVTVRFRGFETKTRIHTLVQPTDALKVLESEAVKLILPFFDKRENPGKKPIRLIGVKMEKLEN